MLSTTNVAVASHSHLRKRTIGEATQRAISILLALFCFLGAPA